MGKKNYPLIQHIMKKPILNLVYIAVCLLFVYGCTSKDFEGDYSGVIKDADIYTGIWTASVSSKGNISLELLTGYPATLTGTISGDGEFSITQTNDTESISGEGEIDHKGNVFGTIEEAGWVLGDLTGGKSQVDHEYVGTWYQSSGTVYYKMVLTEASYALYQFDTYEGDYSTYPLDNGTFVFDKNNISVYPSNGINESGKLYIDGETLILALVGLSTEAYEKTDANPNI